MPFFVHRQKSPAFQWSAGLTVSCTSVWPSLPDFLINLPNDGAIRKPCPLRKIDLASTRPELVLALAREMAAALPAPH